MMVYPKIQQSKVNVKELSSWTNMIPIPSCFGSCRKMLQRSAHSLVVLASSAKGNASSGFESEGIDGVCLAQPLVMKAVHLADVSCSDRWLRWHWHRSLRGRCYQLRPSLLESLYSLTVMWFSSSARHFKPNLEHYFLRLFFMYW